MKNKNFTLLAYAALTLPFIHPVSADLNADVMAVEDELFGEFPVVLTATRLKQSKSHSPIATTIIDREMIEASGFTEIVDLLRLAPGMLVNYDSGHIGAAGYQFLFDRYRVRFQVLVDGMSVYTPLQGEMPWTQLGIAVDDIERIEVIRGPSSSSYGPNAMTGVVSIITRHSVLDKGMKFKANQGVNGRSEQFFTAGGNSGTFDYKVTLAGREDQGFEGRYDNKDLALINFRGDYQATKNDTLTIGFSHNSGTYGEDASDGLNDAMPEHNKEVKYTSFRTRWIHNFSSTESLNIHYYRQLYTDINAYIGDYSADGYGDVPTNEGLKTIRDNLELSYSTSSDKLSLNLGALYRRDNTLATEYLKDVDRDVDTKQVFLNTEFRINSSNTINLNLLYDDNITAGKTLSPRVALNHHFSNNHTLRVSYAEATRSPFIFEEYTNRSVYVPLTDKSYRIWQDLSDLTPEKIKTVEVGYIGMLNNNKTEIDIRGYHNKITDLISPKWSYTIDGSGTVTDPGGFKQGDAFDVTGFEATLKHKFSSATFILNYANAKIDTTRLVFAEEVDLVTGSPEDTISLLYIQNFNNDLTGSLGYYYTGSYQQLCCEILQAPRNRLDLVLSKSFQWSGHKSQLKLVLQNVTDEEISTRLYNNYHRQGYISFSIEL